MARTRARGVPERVAEPQSGAALKAMIKQIDKQHGEGLVFRGREAAQPYRIPTGIFALDLATCGGIPVRGVTMFHGRRSSGKTTSSLKTIAQAQRLYPEGDIVLIDQEHTFEPVWAGKLGVDLDRLIVVQPETGEQAVDFIDGFLHTPGVVLVVLDSVASLVPMRELNGSAEDAHVGIHAKLVTTLMRKVTSAFAMARRDNNRHCTFLCINQQRSKIGGYAPPGQEAINLPGGKALDHYTMLQVKFKNQEKFAKDDQGFEMLDMNEHGFQIDKNKMNAGLRKGEFQLCRSHQEDTGLDEGDIDDAGTMLAYGKKMGIYTGAGRAWTLAMPNKDIKFGSGDEAVAHLYENRDDYWILRNHLIALHSAKLGMPQSFLDRFYE
jgi:recombination protein RecA